MTLTLDHILDRCLPVGSKGVPLAATNLRVRDIARQGWNLLDGDLPLPAAVLVDTALRQNAASMAAFTARHRVHLAPHGKTTMAPQLFRRQFDAGAWALTAATPAHLALYLSIGVRRIIYANQLVDPAALAFLGAALAADPDLEIICLVDGFEGACLLADAARGQSVAGRIDVLIELGMPGGRTGLRTPDAAIALAWRIAAELPALRVRGVEAFEGIVPFDVGGRYQVDLLLAGLEQAADAIRSSIHPLTPILSVGGSAFFPLIVDRFKSRGSDFDLVMRSGCYLIHDHGMYDAGQASPFCHRGLHLDPPLRPALEVWGHIQSRPEPGRAYATIGKRDISSDAGLPTPVKWSPRGSREVIAIAAQTMRVAQLNDQHAYLELPPDHTMQVGDRIALGCSHPCTTFDKWQVLYVVDDAYGVVEGIGTCF